MTLDLTALSRAKTSTFPVVVPPNKKLYDFQVAGVEYMCVTKRMINADEMGCGKSIEAIVAMNTLGVRDYVIVCPKSLVDNWRREVKSWNVTAANVSIMSYGVPEKIVAEAKRLRCQAIIFDESHYLQNPDAKRTKALLKLLDLPVAFCLTGTPITNRTTDIFTILSRLIPTKIGCRTLYDFGVRYSHPHHNGWKWEYKGVKNGDRLFRLLRGNCMLRRLKKDVLTSLPEKTRRGIYLAKDRDAEKLIEQEIGYYDLHLRKRLTPEAGNAALLVRTALGFLKVGPTAEYCKTLLDGGCDKLVIFGFHRDPLAKLVLALARYRPVVITGGTPSGRRQARVDEFQNNPRCRVFIGSVQAAGVGHTLTAASHVIMFECSWVPGENAQAEDRCHRIGQRNAVQVDYVLFEKSADERVLSVVREKADSISSILDGTA